MVIREWLFCCWLTWRTAKAYSKFIQFSNFQPSTFPIIHFQILGA
ncbi:hypothetical protein C943_02973 [Mariniradius saccharolyticus AK6]|uniref:Uncharacterized protein n=1 Tax=Mariniradius saccharolyticus AK6 TaxID=1239962 RepID=M7XCC6_9BACT|nr:hypothetical protein C943_02973 [Mariniradius saccharolyticus AK6]